jgi:hypothetical protein
MAPRDQETTMRRILTALALSAASLATQAATVSVYTSLATWEAAITGAAQLQNFDSFASGDSLSGVAVLPGLTLSSNMPNLRVFGADKTAFASGGTARQDGNAFYEGSYALPFLAAAMDITAFESDPANPTTAVDQGLMRFWFNDGTTQDVLLSGTLDGSAVFVGVVSDRAITSFRWTEAHEASQGNEETSLDNLRVAMRTTNQLPLPGSLPLAALALGLLPLVRRRR